MRTLPPESGFFILLAAGVPLLLLPLFPTLLWLVCLLLGFLPGVILYLTRTWPDRAFYLTCAGQPAAIACGITSVWAGLFVELMLAGMVAGTMGLLTSREDYRFLLLFFGLTVILALAISLSNHVFFLLLALGAGLALLAGIEAIRGYRFRKEYTGVSP
ncbi:MAG: hypothetical protein LUO98_04330 [Methanoregula sp.]|nr:hypothetical protein [Methanoregula sp.]